MTFEEKYKSILLDTFKFAISFLNSHNLRWYVVGGSMIGTVRHKGLIPWDDDVDISMPREDFEKLLALRNELCDTDFEISYLDKDESYYMPFAKISHKNSTLWEFKGFPCVFGVYIDIFPMDLVAGDKEFIYKRMNQYKPYIDNMRRSLHQTTICEIARSFIFGEFRKSLSSLKSYFLYKPFSSYFRHKYRTFELTLNDQNGDYWVCFGGAYGKKEIYKTEWFDNPISMPFENLIVWVPNGYHQLLTQNYGDYMTPPPPEKCIASHDDRYYVNLIKRISIAEAKEQIRKGITKEY